MRFVLRTDAGRRPVTIPTLGRLSVHNALAGAAVGRAAGLSLDEIAAGLAAGWSAPHRVQLVRLGGGDDRRRHATTPRRARSSPRWTCWPGCPAGGPRSSARCSSSARRATRATGPSARPPPGPSTGWSWSGRVPAGDRRRRAGGRAGPGPRHPGPRCRGRPRPAARRGSATATSSCQGVARDRPRSRRRRPPPRPRHGAPAR